MLLRFEAILYTLLLYVNDFGNKRLFVHWLYEVKIHLFGTVSICELKIHLYWKVPVL